MTNLHRSENTRDCRYCRDTAPSPPAYAKEKFKVITTFTVIADMAKKRGGRRSEVSRITKPGAENYEYRANARRY